MDPSSEHPILEAIRNNRREDALELASSWGVGDVNDNDDGSTPLLLASLKGWGDVVGALCERGANCNVKSELGETPLIRSVKNGKISPEIIEKILRSGGAKTVNNQTTEQNYFPLWTALHFACDGSLNPHTHTIAVLLAAGADPSVKNAQGKTPSDIAQGFPEHLRVSVVCFVFALLGRTRHRINVADELTLSLLQTLNDPEHAEYFETNASLKHHDGSSAAETRKNSFLTFRKSILALLSNPNNPNHHATSEKKE